MAQPEQDPNIGSNQLYSNLVELIDRDVFRNGGSEMTADFITDVARLYDNDPAIDSETFHDVAEQLSNQILSEGVNRVLEQSRPRLHLVDDTYVGELHANDAYYDEPNENRKYGNISPPTSKPKNIRVVSRVRMETMDTEDGVLDSPWEEVLSSSFTRVEEVEDLKTQARDAIENPDLRQKVAWYLAGKDKRAISRFSLVGELLGVQEMDDMEIVNAVAEMASEVLRDKETGQVTGGSIRPRANHQPEETEL